MAYSITDHLRYNVWANTRIADILGPVSDVIVFEERKSSFPSIAKTLLHIRDAEIVWSQRMHGESPAAFPSANFDGDKKQLLDCLVNSSRELLLAIESKGADFLSMRYDYTNMKGEPFKDTVEDTLFHVVNHGTYHRGQVITMLREANVTKLLSTDLIHYVRSLR
jgi:uncharacterized damage-inducible protein DinB